MKKMDCLLFLSLSNSLQSAIYTLLTANFGLPTSDFRHIINHIKNKSGTATRKIYQAAQLKKSSVFSILINFVVWSSFLCLLTIVLTILIQSGIISTLSIHSSPPGFSLHSVMLVTSVHQVFL